MWKLVYGSVPGTSHVESGLPCQDFCEAKVVDTTLIAACADGAGSAEYSHFGSRAAVDCFMEIAVGDTIPTSDQIFAWVEAARDRLLEEAVKKDTTPRQLACTFLAVLAGSDWSAFVQIGDGAIVFDGPDGYELAFWPDIGEYANATRFLSDDDYRDHLKVNIINRNLSEIAVMTDGLQMLALDFAGARVHDRFFSPLFNTVRNGLNEEALKTSLLGFMDSKRVNERTDDDKTLLLATQMTADVSQELPDSAA